LKYPNILNPIYTSYLLAYEDETECSETLAFKLQTPVNQPEESIRHTEHSESLKSGRYKTNLLQNKNYEIQTDVGLGNHLLNDKADSQKTRNG
jgi:hypothetical protein